MGSGQVDPKLHHLERPAPAGEVEVVVFFVEHPCACCHPLHVALSNDPAVSCTVVVSYKALVGNGHGFKSAVRVDIDTPGKVAGRQIGK